MSEIGAAFPLGSMRQGADVVSVESGQTQYRVSPENVAHAPGT